MERARPGHHARAAAPLIVAAGLIVAVAPGCGAAPASSTSAAATPAQAGKVATTQGTKQAPAPGPQTAEEEQRAAQQVWCSYLQDLYLRAAGPGAGGWPRYPQCLEVRTMASPRMLRQTAECSRRALDRFEGDPFTMEYAAEVSRCGAQALDSAADTAPDLVPYVAAICGRVVECEDVDFAECRETLEAGLGPQLQRAVGAMNERGRTELRTCFSGMTCGDIGEQMSACIEPILDSMLWLPG